MKLPRAIVINDISGYGKCALGISLPVISACGVEVLPVPTAVLSSNMKFSGYQLTDLSDKLKPFLKHLTDMNIQADGLYTGFMCSCAAVDAVIEFAKSFNGLKLVDPIMGDNGRLYSRFTPELCAKIKELCLTADIITPNYTEAHILAGLAYDDNASSEHIQILAEKLRALFKTTILTGVPHDGKLITFYINDHICFPSAVEKIPRNVSGAGDLFASIVMASQLNGRDMIQSINFAMGFISECIKDSANYDDFTDRGICFEPHLHKLYLCTRRE